MGTFMLDLHFLCALFSNKPMYIYIYVCKSCSETTKIGGNSSQNFGSKFKDFHSLVSNDQNLGDGAVFLPTNQQLSLGKSKWINYTCFTVSLIISYLNKNRITLNYRIQLDQQFGDLRNCWGFRWKAGGAFGSPFIPIPQGSVCASNQHFLPLNSAMLTGNIQIWRTKLA